MIAAVRADLQRFFKFPLVKRVVAFETFNENAFGFDALYFVGGLFFNFRMIALEPRHIISSCRFASYSRLSQGGILSKADESRSADGGVLILWCYTF